MDMSQAIVPKSDQLNADDLIAGPITIKITGVTIKPGEQPVSIFYEGDNGKPYKCCKSMARILVSAWGADASKYTGRSLTLYRDPTVKWGGMEVGGIRISHMSHIDSAITMALTVTRANKKPFTVKPLVGTKNAAPQQTVDTARSASGSTALPTDQSATDAATITPDEALALEVRCTENDIPVASLKKAAKVERLSLMLSDDLPRAHTWIDSVIAKRNQTEQV